MSLSIRLLLTVVKILACPTSAVTYKSSLAKLNIVKGTTLNIYTSAQVSNAKPVTIVWPDLKSHLLPIKFINDQINSRPPV